MSLIVSVKPISSNRLFDKVTAVFHRLSRIVSSSCSLRSDKTVNRLPRYEWNKCFSVSPSSSNDVLTHVNRDSEPAEHKTASVLLLAFVIKFGVLLFVVTNWQLSRCCCFPTQLPKHWVTVKCNAATNYWHALALVEELNVPDSIAVFPCNALCMLGILSFWP